MAAHRYWRLNIKSNGGLNGLYSIAELTGATSVGGANVLTGGTASGGNSPANAFDGNAATYWASFVSSPNVTQLNYDLGGSPADIIEITIKGRNDGFVYQTPVDFDWQYSDDNTNWFTQFTRTGTQYTTPGEARTYNNVPVSYIRNTNEYVLVAQNFPTPNVKNTGITSLVAAKADTNVRMTDTYALVAIVTGGEDRMLRAWQFTQDDHDFYVVLASNETYVYDKLSETWSQWKSPDASYWRGVDGSDWEGINVCIDPDNGKIYQIDPYGRLDYGTTPITSVIYGGMTERFRKMTPCYMAEVAVSQAKPPANIDATTVGIKLETSDTINWVDHGTLTGQATGNKMTVRFYGLGLIQSPGVVFKITDTGYARRIDGLDVEMAGTPDGG